MLLDRPSASLLTNSCTTSTNNTDHVQETMTSPVQPTLIKFADNIWTVDGPNVSFFGFPYPTRMVVIALKDKTSWIWSPIAVEGEGGEALFDDVESTAGPVRYIVSPNLLHWVFMKKWQDRFPEARMFASPGLRDRKVAEGLRFDGDLNGTPDPAWADEIDQTIFDSGGVFDEVVFFHKPTKTVLFTDFIQRQDGDFMKGWKGWAMRLDGIGGENGSTPRELRFIYWWGGHLKKARETLDHVLLDWAPDRLIIAHGACATSDAVSVIERGLRWIPPKQKKESVGCA
jgi:Domain of unknown function (DUF4336)